MMRKCTLACFCLLGLGLSLALPGIAQINTGTVVGTVRDPQNSAIPAATVSLTNTGTGDVRNAETNNLGEFVFPAVIPGSYTVKVAKQGFRPVERRGLALSSSQTLSVGTLAVLLANSDLIDKLGVAVFLSIPFRSPIIGSLGRRFRFLPEPGGAAARDPRSPPSTRRSAALRQATKTDTA
jgi:hypothetical protein